MNLPRLRFSTLASLAAFTLVALPSLAAPEPEAKAARIPDALKPWQAWVLWDDDHRACPTPFNDAKKHRCFWPSQLVLQVDKAGAQWQLGVSVFKNETWVPLPGGAEAWPVEVKAGDAALPVVERDGKPAIRLPAGAHQLAGAFRWSELPARLPLPREIGLLALTLEGQPVPAPAWDAEGTLWLRREAAPAAEEANRDFLSTKVHALLEDGIPLTLRVEIELVVAGKSREETLGTILPEGWKLSSVESPIPVAIDPATGTVKAQVRAGRWTVRADAFRLDRATELRYAPGAKPAAAEQLVAFAAKPELRLVEIIGAPAIDVSQTPFPDAWRAFPVHRWDTAQPFRFEERLRGPGEGKPAGLTIRREWWLDENGRALTFRDRLSGTMQQTWRLDAAPGQDLGAVRASGSGAGDPTASGGSGAGQLITRNPTTGAPGVEIRTRAIDLDATGRMPSAAALPATGWRADADALDVTLHLPPGWRLFALFGADWVRGDWLTAWTLLDVFLLLVFSVAVFRMFGLGAAALACAAFAISYLEPGAPRGTWIMLLIPIALQRLTLSDSARWIIAVYKWGVIVMLVALLVPFVAKQVQQALYPQLENVSEVGEEAVFGFVRFRHHQAAPDFAASDGAVPSAPAAAEPATIMAAIEPGLSMRTQRKLEMIIIPRLEFREASFRDAIDFLKQRSIDLDTTTTDPAQKGVNIVVKTDTSPTPPSLDSSSGDTRITVSLTNIPLGEALRYVTGLANFKYKIEQYGVFIVPASTPAESSITKAWKVAPGFFAAQSSAEISAGVARNQLDVKEFLAAQGVTFPPDSSAIYIPATSTLIVRNTQENLDLIDGLMPAGSASSAPTTNLEYDPKARIQTGPAVPDWEWRQVSFGWNGPVQAGQQVRPILIPLWLERVLSILRVALLLALAAVLLGAKKAGGALFSPRRKAPAAAAALALFLSLAASTRAQETPDPKLLDTLRERLLEPGDAFPHAADIPSASLALAGDRLTLDAEIHVAARCAVPLPGRLPAWSPVRVLVDDKPDATPVRRDDGFLWVVLPAGVHRVRVEGLLASVAEWEWSFLLKPRRVRVDAPGWNVTGIRPDGTPEAQVFLALQQKAAATEAGYDRQELASIVLVDRHLELGLVWQVRTTVTRLSPPGRALSLRLPLLPGESVVTPNLTVAGGFLEVSLGASETAFSWESTLAIAPRLALATRAEDTWVERWHLAVSPVWNVAFAGLAPIFEASNPELTPVWQPWPGEAVELAISRPEAIAGATVTVSRGAHEIALGKRQRISKLELSLRSSLGEDFLLDLPADADITTLALDAKPIPVRKDGTRLVIPLKPGEQTISAAWKINTPLAFSARAEPVRLPVESANISTHMTVPEDRWVLWATGPRRGPAVRFWVILICALLAAVALGRVALSPLRTAEWMLLILGLTQVPLPAALLVIAWLFLLAWRGRDTFPAQRPLVFNLLQLALAALTAISLGILICAVGEGLLGSPEMFIRGNGSTHTALRWFQPRSDTLLPTPGCLSVSVWWYRLLMLLWALWLALALLRWLRTGWENFTRGGLLRRAAQPPPLRAEAAGDGGIAPAPPAG